MKKIIIIYEATATGYAARAKHYAAYTTGGTWDELQTNMAESLNFYLEEKGDANRVTVNDLEFTQL